MKFLHSIRWQIQLWHGLLLGLVLAGFGLTALKLEQANLLRRLDQELDQHLAPVPGRLHGPNGPDGPNGPEGEPPPPPPDPPEGEPEMPGFPPRLGLDASLREFFNSTPNQPYYFAVWLHNGHLVGSNSAPANIPRPEGAAPSRVARLRGTLREVALFTPRGDCALIGRDIGEELAGIRRAGWYLAGAGAAVFVLGLAGGNWISSRALRPIRTISQTAAKIAEGDLGQRIPKASEGNELGTLVEVLNHTFERLQASFARQAQFTADASHELRTPLAVLLTQTQSALARERSAAEYRESLEACQRSAQRMRRLTDSLLVLARLDSGEAAAPDLPCDLERIISETVGQLRPMASEKGISLEEELSPVRCKGEPGQLAQVLTNLVANAIHYNRPGGSVVVRLLAEPGAAVISVTDTGIGISPEDLPRVFERFYRADKSRSSGGAGIGLAITQAIVEAHGGSIRAESALGKGSTFTVRLALDKSL